MSRKTWSTFQHLFSNDMSSEQHSLVPESHFVQPRVSSSPPRVYLMSSGGVLQKPGQGLDCLDWSDSLQTALELGEKARGGVMGATMSSGWPYR